MHEAQEIAHGGGMREAQEKMTWEAHKVHRLQGACMNESDIKGR